MNKEIDVAIIGAGTAGLSAFKEASKFSKKVVIIDKGPLGTTCARVGCMPSKILIQAANYFHHRHYFAAMGIRGDDKLSVEIPDVLAYVRQMRDQFTAGVVKYTQSLGEQFICGEARLISPEEIKVGNQIIRAKAIIIATGSHSVVPKPWRDFDDKILTSETIFEQNNLPNDIAVIGAGSIGLEFGQALARLGINIVMFNASAHIGGLSDPRVNETAVNLFRDAFPMHLNEKVALTEDDGRLIVAEKNNQVFDRVVAAMGRAPNIDSLGLKELDIPFTEQGIPKYDKTTMQIDHCSIFLAGDVNQARPLLHEAADEGRIAGFNATHSVECFHRRTPLRILFTEPNIAVVGQGFSELDKKNTVIGGVSFSDQGRAKIMRQNNGLLRVYGHKKTGKLLGAEMIAPDGEHMAHLLAWATFKELTVFDVLQMPFYHPVVEEGMRTALRDLASQVEEQSSAFDLAMCDSEALPPLS